MDYKKYIIKLLEELDERRLRYVYFFIRGLLGIKQEADAEIKFIKEQRKELLGI